MADEVRLIDANNLLKGIEELKQSPWYNFGKFENDILKISSEEYFYHRMYLERKEAIDTIVELSDLQRYEELYNELIDLLWHKKMEGFIDVKELSKQFDTTR